MANIPLLLNYKAARLLVAFFISITLAACGGGGGSASGGTPDGTTISISGTVQETASGKPSDGSSGSRYAVIPNATVQILTLAGVVITTTTTDSNGQYSVDVPPSVDYIVRASKGNILLKSLVTAPSANTTANVHSNSTAIVTVISQNIGNSNLGEEGVDTSSDLANINLVSLINTITTDGTFTSLVAAIETDITTNGDYNDNSGTSTIGSGSTNITIVIVIVISSDTVDNTSPSAPTVTGTTPTEDTTPTWSWSAGGGGNGIYRYKLDDSDLTTGYELTVIESYTPASPISVSVHTLYVQERDSSGNWSLSGSFVITVNSPADTTAPSAPVISSPTTGSSTNDATPAVSGTAEADSAVELFDSDGTTSLGTTTATGGNWSITSSTLSTTTHSLTAKATDAAGNVSSASTAVSVTIDTTAPSAPSVTGSTPTNDTTPTWSWTAGGGGNGDYRYKLDDSDLSTGATTTTGTTYTPGSPLSAGTYTLYVQEQDDAGNWSTSGSLAITIDTTAPTITLKSPDSGDQNVAVDTTISITFSKAMATGTITTSTFSIDNSVTGTIAFTGDTVATFTPSSNLASNTVYTATVTTSVTDTAGNALASTNNWSFTTVPTVGPLYSNGANWNYYVQNDGADVYSATDSACGGTETGGYSACIHGGEKLAVEVPGKSACTNLTATDSLGAFDWICDSSTDPVKMISTALNDGKYLSDLIDFSTPGWLSNSVTVSESSTELFTTASSTSWWSNTITEDNDGGSLSTAGTVYIVTADPSAVYTLDADNIGLAVKPTVTLSGAGSNGYVISASSQNFLWIEGNVEATGDSRGVSFSSVKFSVLRNVKVQNADNGVYLTGSLNNLITDITATNIGSYGVTLASNSDSNALSNLTLSNNGITGLLIHTSSENSITGVTSFNNETHGVHLRTAVNNTLSSVTAANNLISGVHLSDTSDNNMLSNITGVNNEFDGLDLYYSSNSTASNVATANNGIYSVFISNASSSDFTGLLKVGNNGTSNCYVEADSGTGGGIDDDSGAVDGTHDGDCIQDSPSDFGTATTGITLASSFDDKVTADDSANSSDTSGVAAYPADPSTFDWFSFDNSFRGWGIDGGSFPDAGATNRGRCTTGNCSIWDWSILSGDSVIRAVLTKHTAADSADTITHTWSVSSPASQSDCDTAVPGSTYSTSGGNHCENSFLINAVEITGDGIGNENGLCESNETCLYTPNIGSYQGHDSITNAISVTGDTLTGITLKNYGTNGR